MRTQRVEFRAPAGAVPEGTQPGEEFDLVSTFRMKDNGDCCLVMMGDSKMPGYDKGDGKPGDYTEYGKAIGGESSAPASERNY